MTARTRNAHLYVFPDFVVLIPVNTSVDGVGLEADPIARLGTLEASAETGAALRNALGHSRRGVPHPTDWKLVASEVRARNRAAGIKSAKHLHESAKLVVVRETDLAFEVTPCRNGGSTGPDRGYHDLTDATLTLDRIASDEELGRAIARAAAICR
jgi:hypothetical protein